jgi:hypothetical protein
MKSALTLSGGLLYMGPMTKKLTKGQEFKRWLARFRATGAAPNVLCAEPGMSDDELRRMWEASRAVRKQISNAHRPRKPKEYFWPPGSGFSPTDSKD